MLMTASKLLFALYLADHDKTTVACPQSAGCSHSSISSLFLISLSVIHLSRCDLSMSYHYRADFYRIDEDLFKRVIVKSLSALDFSIGTVYQCRITIVQIFIESMMISFLFLSNCSVLQIFLGTVYQCRIIIMQNLSNR